MIFFLILYDLIFLLGLFIYLAHHFYYKKINLSALKEKLTLYSSRINQKKTVWFHGVSVGEVLLIKKIVDNLKNKNIVISTTTLTGRRTAESRYSSYAIIYFPFDISFLVRRAIKIINPKVFITLETEIWPNLFYYLKRKGVPIIILNGRISEKAFFWYKKVKWLIKLVLRNVEFVGVQNELYKKRFLSLGVDEKKIKVLGNLKFESISVDEEKQKKFQEKFSFLKKEQKLIIVAGSTHHPEEEIILKIYKDLLPRYNILLIIAPRHIERINYLEKIIEKFSLSFLKITEFSHKEPLKDIYLVNTVGELLYFYSIADICFVGGSLADYGGHNILEPLYFFKPTIFGSYMDNFKDIEEEVLRKKAALKIRNEKELKNTLKRLIESSTLRENLERNAYSLFSENRDILRRNLEVLKRWLD
ncbi:MAG: hypothetical protein B6D56_04165 [Candidatus Omnitrophica bacterium 4484_70.1]|nr:MAG: hypothetical protein B6D56_04165 [Candidatus Omnitrophica bacterium 4484_70.1]